MKQLVILLAVFGCTRPSEERAAAEAEVGTAALSDVTVEVADGLAAIRDLADHRLQLWAGAPSITFTINIGPTAGGDWTLIMRNVLVDSFLVENGTDVYPRDAGQYPTVGIFHVVLAPGPHVFRVAPLDADIVEPFRVASMADIQTALPEVDDVFEMISAVPDARFVIAMGDITQRSEISEYELFERQLATLTIPFYTTLGNHELWGDFSRFHERYGRASFHCEFKGAAFSFVDSGDAGLDPLTEQWLDGWLAKSKDQLHVFLTHIPPIDPVGTRYGGFRSEQDGRRLLSRLVDGNVDLTLYGHIHTYVKFDNAGIPAHISGGGGAEPMKWDGINRHFLVIDLDPAAGSVRSVEVQRVD